MRLTDALHELDRRGITATVASGRIELRPGTAVDDRFKLALARIRDDLIRVLAIKEAVHGRIMERPIRPVPPRRQADPHDFDTCDTDPRLPEGWTRKHWIDRLRYVASGCEDRHPARAKELRQQADELADPMGGCSGWRETRETGGLLMHTRDRINQD